MGVSLVKGGKVSLTKAAPGLTAIMVGMGWDVRKTDGEDFDLDATVFICGADGKVLSDESFIYFGNLKNGGVEHLGDNRTGAGDGDDEQVKVDLNALDANAEKLVFAVTIYEAEKRKQSFGQVSNAFIRVVNQADGVELARFDLSEDASTNTAMIFAEVYRKEGEWRLNAVGQGFDGGLAPLAQNHGVNVG